MDQFKTCLLCGSDRLCAMQGYEKDHLCKCRSCGFVFAQRIPSQKELLDEYAQYARNDSISEITLKRYDELLQKFEKYRRNNAIIDVGAGDGQLISRAKQRRWNAYATEFDDRSVELCRQKGVSVHQGKLDAGNYEDDFFDVICSVEVIEHINNPLEEVRNFHKILRKGGLVYVTTPNLNSVSHKLLKNRWNIFHYPEHLCYYTPRTLEKLFKEAGFKKVWIETTGFSPGRFYQSVGSKQAQGSGPNNQNDEALRSKTETKFFWKLLKRTINGVLTLTKTGDNLKAAFVKE